MQDFYFFGDTHRSIDMKKIKEVKTDINKTNKFFILGDWGGLWHNNFKKDYKFLIKWINLQQEKNFELFIIPGNHENYNVINKLPETVIENKDNYIKVKILKIINPWTNKYKGTFYILKNGIHKINNKNVLTIRGAMSIDKKYRTENIDWWKQEILTEKEKENIINEIKSYNGKFDYVLSHTCPVKIAKKLVNLYNYEKINDPNALFLQDIYDKYLKNKFNLWLFGHFHKDYEIEYNKDKFICLYNKLYVKNKDICII